MELQERIENIENIIKSLQEELEILKEGQIEPVKEPYKRWRAELGDEYWHVYVGNCLAVTFEQEQGHSGDDRKYQLGNYFQTEQEAQDYLDNLITKQELKDLALELNNGDRINWENREQRKYFIIYDNYSKNFRVEFCYDNQDFGQVYCLDIHFLGIAEERIGQERLIKLIKSGV